MEWVKPYTTFHDHGKTGRARRHLHRPVDPLPVLECAQDTDGFIPRRIALRFLASELGDEAAARLVRVGLWAAVEDGSPPA